MFFYCLCKEPDADNRILKDEICFDTDLTGIPLEEMEKTPHVVLKTRMRPIKNGVKQFVASKPIVRFYEHSPNVDLYECPKCGTKIVRE